MTRCRVIFSRLGNRKNDLVSPRPSSEWSSFGPHLALLAETVLAEPPLREDPRLLRSTFGPSELVDPFLTNWPVAVAPPAKDDKLAQQTLRLQHIAEVPSPSPLPQGHVVERGTKVSMNQADKEAMCWLLESFYTWDQPTDEPLARMSHLEDTMDNGALYVYRIEGGEIVSFVVLGRPTTKTIAIRNVYTHPKYRGQGIAERVTREVAKIYLTAERPVYDFKTSPPPFQADTHWGGRGTVCLFVADENPHARRAYIKAGFVDGEQRWVDRVVEGAAPGVW